MFTEDVAKAKSYLETLCNVQPNRRVGSPGNKAATNFFKEKVEEFGYLVDDTPFNCLDYQSNKPVLTCQGSSFEVKISPHSLGCEASAQLAVASTVEELEKSQCTDRILLLIGEVCAEQLMPKNFVFYNPDHHKKIISLLEEKQPKAIITATTKNQMMVGNIYPFPLINDGDFDIPSVYCTDKVGKAIAAKSGEIFKLEADAKRIPTTASNVVARLNPQAKQKITVCAHIDTVEDTPGASDNASGVVTELILADKLKDYQGKMGIEIIAFNGEDHYSVAGQMDYLKRYSGEIEKIVFAINIDDVGYRKGKTAYSFYECPKETEKKTRTVFNKFPELVSGDQWFQGDHMIFVQNKKPAIAITSEKMAELMMSITHSQNDTTDIIDCKKLVNLAYALDKLGTSF